jgi:hypothetical protein
MPGVPGYTSTWIQSLFFVGRERTGGFPRIFRSIYERAYRLPVPVMMYE